MKKEKAGTRVEGVLELKKLKWLHGEARKFLNTHRRVGRSGQGRPIKRTTEISPFKWVAFGRRSQRTFTDMIIYFIYGRFKVFMGKAT